MRPTGKSIPAKRFYTKSRLKSDALKSYLANGVPGRHFSCQGYDVLIQKAAGTDDIQTVLLLKHYFEKEHNAQAYYMHKADRELFAKTHADCLSAIRKSILWHYSPEGVCIDAFRSDDTVMRLKNCPQNGILEIPDTICGKPVVALPGVLLENSDRGQFILREWVKIDRIPDTVTSYGEWASIAIMFSQERLTVNEGTTRIPPDFLIGNRIVRQVVLPSSVEVIGNFAFASSNLEQINIEQTSVCSVGSEAFSACKLVEIVLPASVRTVGTDLFRSCTKLKKIDLSRTEICTIPYGMLTDTKDVTAILPETVKTIQDGMPIGARNAQCTFSYQTLSGQLKDCLIYRQNPLSAFRNVRLINCHIDICNVDNQDDFEELQKDGNTFFIGIPENEVFEYDGTSMPVASSAVFHSVEDDTLPF